MATEESAGQVAEESPPIIVELGKERRKRIRQLKRGRGPLIDEVHDVIDHVKAGLGPDAQSKHLVPIVLIYRKRGRRRGGGVFPFF